MRTGDAGQCQSTREGTRRQHRAKRAVHQWNQGMARVHLSASGVGDNVSLYESVMEFIATNGRPVRLEQVSVAKWKNGKMIHERFDYDTGKQAV